jgi:putative PIN family toxin of toxin-antitoxin system
MSAGTRVVFDCNTFVQALSSPHGPAGRCVKLSLDAKVQLFISPAVIDELRDVLCRPKLVHQLHLTAHRVAEFIRAIEAIAIHLEGFPEPFTYKRDPDDAHYVNLALAAEARLIVSRDADLLDLMNLASAEGAAFHRNFPDLLILNPVQFLKAMGAGS